MAESSAFSNAAEDEVINLFIRNQARTFGTSLFVALVTASIAEASTGANIAEVADGNGYARQAVSFDAAAAGATSNSAAVNFTASGGNWGTITGMCIVDSGTHGAGNVVMFDNSMTDVTINNGDSLSFAAGDIDISIF